MSSILPSEIAYFCYGTWDWERWDEKIIAILIFCQDYRLVSTNVSLNKHNHSHDDEGVSTLPILNDRNKPHICTECSRGFSKKSDMKRHLRTHTGERPFSCSHCDYTCALKGDLKKHIRRHTGEKPFSCDVCGKSFTVSSSLKHHLLTHTGEKPHSCEHCGKSFGTKNGLTKHSRISCKAQRMWFWFSFIWTRNILNNVYSN